jgi:hypothetical protein
MNDALSVQRKQALDGLRDEMEEMCAQSDRITEADALSEAFKALRDGSAVPRTFGQTSE